MNTSPRNRAPTPWSNERGSTLILVVLLTLILSASAIVSMRDVARTAQAAGVYRTRAQAQLTSASANSLFADWVGNKAATLIDAMQNSTYGAEAGSTNVYGGRDNGPSGSTAQERREGLAILGGELEFNYKDLQSDCGGTCVPLIDDYSNPQETGLFQTAAGQETFETRRSARWRVKIRDLSDGFPAVGYSDKFCFKKAVIASESLVGRIDPNWARANNVAQARHAEDAMIGPVECGYN